MKLYTNIDLSLYISILLNYLKDNNSSIEINCIDNNSFYDIFDENLFYLSGQLLAILYALNIDKNDISYSENTFNISNISIKNYFTICNYEPTSENLITSMINSSVFFKNYLPLNINVISEKNLIDLESGFKFSYNIFTNNKLDILTSLNPLNIDNHISTNTLSMLNNNDMLRQLKFLRIKYGKYTSKNKLLLAMKNKINIMDKFIKSSCLFLDLAIESSILGFGKYGLQRMWIEYNNNVIQPTKLNNIYFALIFAFISKNTNKNIYLEVCKNSISPLLSYIDLSIQNKKIDSEIISSINILYILNLYINFSELNDFLNNNILTKNICKKSTSSNVENKVFNYIVENGFNVFDNVIF